jgi:hypothetical protein
VDADVQLFGPVGYDLSVQNDPAPRPPRQERRRHQRLTVKNARVRCVSGEFDDLVSSVNFATRLVNIGLGGMCVETTGRLRPGVKLSGEVRFDDFNGALRTQCTVLWVDTKKDGALETHLAGLRFVGPEFTVTVREFLEGGRATMIVTKRQAEYEDLKAKAEARKATVAIKRWGVPQKLVVTFLVLVFLYIGSFTGLVFAGRRDAPSGGTHFRYTRAESKDSGIELTLSKLYLPLYWAIRKGGCPVTYDDP